MRSTDGCPPDTAPASCYVEGAGALVQALDWHNSPLGPRAQWPDSLKTIISTLLPAKAQIVLFWGEDYVAFYNDAYAPTIGAKHPQAMGRPAQEHWRELWDDLEPLLRGVRETGEAFSAKDRPFYIERSGCGETVWFDVSYSPVWDGDAVGGVLCIVTETTQRVQFQRRQAFLLELSQTLPGIDEPDAVERYAIRRLGEELGAARVGFIKDLGDREHTYTEQDWVDGLPSVTGSSTYRALHLCPYTMAADGEVIEARDAAGEVSSLYVPIVHGGALEAVFCVAFARGRIIGEDERLLIEEAARQTWSRITHAWAERSLRAKSAHLETTLTELVAIRQTLEERVDAILEEREAALVQLHEVRKMEMIGQLTGGIAHDFNNMLTPIIASLELMRRKPDDHAGSAKLINCALQASERARNVVSRLLSFARRQTLQPQSVCLAVLVEGMRELIARSLGPTIAVQVQIDDCLPTVMVDPQQLELALLNLVVNARDAMPQGGVLTLTAGRDQDGQDRPPALQGDLVWLRVSDTGCGMSDEVLSRCAEPFYSTKGVGKGTGLGLPMVQGLAAQTGGGLHIRSRPGQGAAVTIWLPVGGANAVTPPEDKDPAPTGQMANRILLVDDEAIVRQAIALQLRDLGYQVTEAEGPAQARALIEGGLQIDLLITDLIMAQESGASLARHLCERCAQLPVLIITGYADVPPQALFGFELLRKPFRRAELAQSLGRLLGTGQG